jgi:hypothetical protein
MGPITLLCLASIKSAPAPAPWHDAVAETLAQRFAPPAGLHRVEVPPEWTFAFSERRRFAASGCP